MLGVSGEDWKFGEGCRWVHGYLGQVQAGLDGLCRQVGLSSESIGITNQTPQLTHKTQAITRTQTIPTHKTHRITKKLILPNINAIQNKDSMPKYINSRVER